MSKICSCDLQDCKTNPKKPSQQYPLREFLTFLEFMKLAILTPQ